MKFRALASLRMDKVNRPGIMSFATAFLTRNLSPSTQEEKNIIESLAKDVTTKSAGVFLWARFAVLAIIDAKGQGLNEHALNAKLEMLPPDLEKIYAKIFESKSSEDREKSGIVLRLVTSAKRDILLSELFEASYLAGVLTRPSGVLVNKAELHDFARYTLALGGGVLELCPVAVNKGYSNSDGEQSDGQRSGRTSGSDQDELALSRVARFECVKIIHRSVQTYLDEGGWSILLGDYESSTCMSLTWLKVCAAFCEQDKLRWTNPERLSSWSPWSGGFSGVLPDEESSTAPPRAHAEVALFDFVGFFFASICFRLRARKWKVLLVINTHGNDSLLYIPAYWTLW